MVSVCIKTGCVMGVNNCGDWSDESHCNGSRPIPTTPGPTPTPQPHSGGSKGGKYLASLHILSR